MDNTKNTLDSLSDNLFIMLESLNDNELFNDKEKAKMMIQRANAVNEIANSMINLGRLELDAAKYMLNATRNQRESEVRSFRLLETRKS